MSAAPADAPRPRRRRPWWLHALFALLLTAGLAVLLATWMLATPWGARMALDRAVAYFGHGAKLTGVEGSLAGTLRIQSVEMKRPDFEARVEGVVIERDTTAPWAGPVVFRRLEAARAEVRTASSEGVASLPLTLRAPYPLRVEDLRIAEVRIGVLAKDGKPAREDVVLKDLRVKGGGDARAWTLERGSIETPWGRLALSGTVGTAAPFPIDLKGELAGEREDLRYRLAARLAGRLERIEAAFEGDGRDLRVEGTAILEPFEKMPLRAVRLRSRDVDLRRFGALPRTRLAIEAELEPAGKGFAGPVRITNAEPGPVDQQRVPIAAAAGRLAWIPEPAGARIELTDATLDFPGAGRAQGSARWTRGRLEARGRVADVDLSRWHTRLQPTKVSGTVSALAEGDANRFEVDLADPRFEVRARAAVRGERVEVETATVKHAGGVVEGKGDLQLRAPRAFRAEGRAARFDPAAFVKGVQGELNFTFAANGVLDPAPAGDIRLDIAPSRLAGLPTQGNVRLSGDARRVSSADVKLAIGDSRIEAAGAFGRAGDALKVVAHVTDLAAIAKPFGIAASGRLDARGVLTGTFAAPGGNVEFDASNLKLPTGVQVAAASGRFDVATDTQGRLEGTVQVKGLARREGDAQQLLAESGTLAVRGTRAAHRGELSATIARDAQLRAAFQGGLDPRAPRPLWRGEIASLSLTGPAAFELVAPATLLASAQRIELGDARLRSEWGEARLAVTRWTPALLEVRGTTQGVAVRNLARALRLPTVPRGNLVLAGDWDLRATDETVDGTISIARVSGDVRVGEPARPLGLRELGLKMDIRRNQARASAAIRGENIGRLDAEGAATLRHVRAGLGIVPDAPLTGRVQARMDSLAWMAAWMGPEARVDGRLDGEVAVSGTFASPRWTGRLAAQGVQVREPQTGFEAENGTVSLRLRDRAIAVEALSADTPWRPPERAARALQGGPRPDAGRLTAEGAIDLGTRTGAITVKVAAVPVTQLPTRFLALSGEARLEARADGILASGALKADAGWIGALATPLPSVSEDVIVVRTAVPSEERRVRDRLRLDVRFNLGDNLRFTGRGLDTRLAGDLRIAGEPGAGLRATGAIRTVAGTYDAYGQKLTIEHGTLTFFGSLENPSLDVLALRKGLPVEAGVEVLGSVSRPRARLVSLPNVPDPEKISWLVLGRGPADVSQGEAATLVAAATAILGRGSGANQVASRFGFDEVRIGRADTMSALGTLPQSTVAGKTGSASAAEVVSVGKRLTKDVYVVYEQGLADAEGALRIAWQITQRFQLLLRAGYLPGVDAVYRWTFE